MDCAFAMLASGSDGNCAAVSLPGSHKTILIDLGLSPRRTRASLASCAFDPASIGAILLTHLDSDHFHQGWRRELAARPIPVLVREGLAEAALAAGVPRFCLKRVSQETRLGTVARLRACHTPHDQLGSTAWRIECEAGSIGYATDLGSVTDEAVETLSGVDILGLECNYDHAMQARSARPESLKRRIMGPSGHLSNAQAIEALARILDAGEPERIFLLHLSAECNCPQLLARLIGDAFPSVAARVEIAPRGRPTARHTFGRARETAR